MEEVKGSEQLGQGYLGQSVMRTPRPLSLNTDWQCFQRLARRLCVQVPWWGESICTTSTETLNSKVEYRSKY